MNRLPSKDVLRLIVLVLLIWVWMVSYRLSEVPPVWFDEGWTLARARTWVETGDYARLLEGQPISAQGMSWGLPVTIPVAASFKLFGVGLWQGRLPITFFSAGSILAYWWLSKRVYGLRDAMWGLIVILLLPAQVKLNLLYLGRQTLGEVPMIFFLLMGYLFAERFLNQTSTSVLFAGLFWGLALESKSQLFPFWLIAILVPAIVSFNRQERTSTRRFLWLMMSSLAAWSLIRLATWWLEVGIPPYGPPMQGLYQVTAFVPDFSIRLGALKFTLIFGWFAVIGILYEAKNQARFWFRGDQNRNEIVDPTNYLRLSIFSLMTSWLLWYVFFSIGWDRYFFPIYFFSSIPLANLLSNILKPEHKDESRTSHLIRWSCGIFILVYGFFFNIKSWQVIDLLGNSGAEQTANWVNNYTSKDAVIETFDSGLLFLLNRSVHYPSDQVQVDLNRRAYLSETVEINYPPPELIIDYLIIGHYSRLWGLYDVLLQSGDYRLIREFPEYDIYQHNGSP